MSGLFPSLEKRRAAISNHWKTVRRPKGFLAGFAAAAALAAAAEPAPSPPRLRRADAFLGIHFDFHAGSNCTAVGSNTTPEMVGRIIDLVRPDYLQIDGKGHPGLSSYPTKAGHPAPGFVGDPLRVWRDVTAARGVALFMHYSGVWDSEAVRRHPDWAAQDAAGKPSDRATSVFGPYAERLMIPQLRELAGEYGVDGAWVDGDCWAAVPDWSEPARKAFREATGLADVPRKAGDPHWIEFLQFQREGFRAYLRRNLAELKKTHPSLQYCSNWAFSDHMPEPVSAPVDFLSGDFSPDDSVNSARLAARYLMHQGKPWDLMAWSFSRLGVKGGAAIQKPALQLQREAAVVLALGGGFQAYYKQGRDGAVNLDQMPVMAEVAAFCRARQKVCHRAESVPQVAVLYSTAAHYREANGLFPRDTGRVAGALRALVENQFAVDLVSEHHLAGRMAQYPLIVVPEWNYLDPAFRDELAAYARGGGHLLLFGAAARLFAAELDAKIADAPGRDADMELDGHPVRVRPLSASLGPRARSVGAFRAVGQTNAPAQPAASITPLGKGAIAAVYFNLGESYKRDPRAPLRAFLGDLARTLFPQPRVTVAGSHDVDVSVMRKDGRLLVNLVNTAGPHADRAQPILDSIPPVGPLDIRIRMDRAPKAVTLEPGGSALAHRFQGGEVRVVLPRLDVHEVVAVD